MNDTPTLASMLVPLRVKNPEECMQCSGRFVVAMFAKIGAQVVAVSPAPKVLEESWGGNWTVVIRFPSRTVAEAWYHSPECQPLKDLRIHELTEGRAAVFVEGFEPAALRR